MRPTLYSPSDEEAACNPARQDCEDASENDDSNTEELQKGSEKRKTLDPTVHEVRLFLADLKCKHSVSNAAIEATYNFFVHKMASEINDKKQEGKFPSMKTLKLHTTKVLPKMQL